MISLKKILRFPYTCYKKIHNNFRHYKLSNKNKKFLLLNYGMSVLFYRRFICPVIALFLLIIYFIFYPLIRFRFIRLTGGSIGHYAMNTECLLAALDDLPNDKFINVFYLEHSLFEAPICNSQLHKMWQRVIFILPLPCSGIVSRLDKLLMYFLTDQAYGMWGRKKLLEPRFGRDIDAYLKNKSRHIDFTEAEHQQAQRELERINIKKTDRYVCLLVRCDAYNKGHPTWDRPERNADVATYMKACYFLAEQGYYVLRMGKVVDGALHSQHPRIIDYARSAIRSDFMDIYLSAHCHFFITTGSGLDGIAQIFRRPILYTNCFAMAYIATWYPHYLFLPKIVIFKKLNKMLSFQESMYYLSDQSKHTDPAFDIFYTKKYLEKHDLGFIDNTEDELLDAVEEMEAMLKGAWAVNAEDQERQKKFWAIFPHDLKLGFNKIPLHGDIDVKIGSKFLAKYQDLLV